MKFNNSKTARLTEHETPYISFPIFEQFPYIKHGFSTRLGGVSEGIYESLNLGFGRGDAKENVVLNYERICKSIGVEPQSLVVSDQVHNTELRKVSKDDLGKGVYVEKDYKGIDGLYTDEANVTLVTMYADCVPLLFVDPVHRAIAASHAGWRGTVAKIGPKTIETMEREYQSKAKNLIVVIGPSICQDCYEVSEDVAEQFRVVIDEIHQESIITPKNVGTELKYQLDLWEANRYLLEKAGVLPENICVSGVCTCCNSDLFHSHRASKGLRGSLSAFLSIVE